LFIVKVFQAQGKNRFFFLVKISQSQIKISVIFIFTQGNRLYGFSSKKPYKALGFVIRFTLKIATKILLVVRK
jgi:hypothetical protein